MNSLSQELKSVIQRRVELATDEQVAAIVGSLCANEQRAAKTLAGLQMPSAERWDIVDDDVAFDRVWQRHWLRDFVPGGDRNHEDCVRAASEVRVRGWTDWRAPEIWEQLSIIDYGCIDPAVDTRVFKLTPERVWTATRSATKDKAQASGDAWFVFLDGGYSVRNGRYVSGRVLAVR